MKKKKNKLIYLIAGEPSGDLHGSHLIKEIKKQSVNEDFKFRGLGGPLMEKEGLSCLSPFEKLSVMGFVEVLKEIFFFLKLKKKIITDIIDLKPDKIILIDYPGFNLSVAKEIKKKSNIKIYYYISPQIWAWKEKRIKKIKQYVDEMIVIFPFEVLWYKSRNFDNVQYFGHPLIDLCPKTENKPNKDIITIGLFPGSRKQEIKKHLPIINETISHFEKLFYDDDKFKNRKLNFLVGIVDKSSIVKEDFTLSDKSKIIFKKGSLEAYKKCNVCIVASGTATLECAITKTPMIVIYKTSFLSWWITKKFINVKFASIVNLIAGKQVVPEFLQNACKPHLMANRIFELIQIHHLKDSRKSPGAIQKKEMQNVINKLGDGKAYKKTANFILTK